MIAQSMTDISLYGRSRRALFVLVPLLALFLGACAQVSPDSSAKQGEPQSTSPHISPEQQEEAKKIVTAKWVAEKKAAEERAAALWAADQRRAEKRAAEKRTTEKRATENRATENRATENRATENRATENRATENRATENRATEKRATEKRAAEKKLEAERLKTELAEAMRIEEELAVADRADTERVGAQRAEAQRAEAQRAEAEQPRPIPKRDWTEVKYPWEEGAEPLLPSSVTAKADKDAGKGAAPKDSEVPREAGEPSPTPQRDWGQVKYPWEESGAVVPVSPSMMEAANKAGPVKRIRRKSSRGHIPVKLTRVAIGTSHLELVKLPGGSFLMGSDNGDFDERPVHEVALPPFQIGRYEVTQRQWQSVMGSNPSYFSDCADCPVDSVSWQDIQLFLEKLNRKTGKKFRLPSEAEWEYACRSDGGETYCGDSDETQVSWYIGNSDGRPQPVGLLEPNTFGLYDMSGNAYEWVQDCWHDGYREAPSDGLAWADTNCQRRVLRGGAWYYAPAYAAATYRNANMPDSRFVIYGFRLAHDGE